MLKKNNYLIIKFLLLIILLYNNDCFSQNNSNVVNTNINEQTNNIENNNDQNDENNKNKNSLNIAPVIYYTPDTSMVFGGMVIFLFKLSDDKSRYSILQPLFFYTLNKQIIATIVSDLYWDDDKNKLTTVLLYKYFPDKFYGVGNHTNEMMEEKFTQKGFVSRLAYQRGIWDKLRIGAGYEFQYSKTVETEQGKILASGIIFGSDKNISTGPGLIISYDYRDNSLSSTSGGLYEFNAYFFTKSLGSSSTFSRYTIDLRQFIPLYTSHTLAFQFYLKINKGEVPLDHLANLGGDKFLRGLMRGRYKDNNMMILQMEYRFIPIIWKIGMTAFISIGQVSHDVKNFKTSEFKLGYGFGLRLVLDKKHRLYFRFDLGFSEGNILPYFIIHEAF